MSSITAFFTGSPPGSFVTMPPMTARPAGFAALAGIWAGALAPRAKIKLTRDARTGFMGSVGGAGSSITRPWGAAAQFLFYLEFASRPSAVSAPLVAQFEAHPPGRCHPERSRFSGGARDLARSISMVRARSFGPLVKARAFGMTPFEGA